MAVSPADFELYSRATGTPLPRTPQEQMQMAPQVYQFIQNRGYQQEGFFDSALGRGLRNAAIIGGAYALGNALKGRKTDPPNDPPGGGGQAVLAGAGPFTPLPPGERGGDLTVTTPTTPIPQDGGNVGVVGSITRDLSNEVDRSDVWDSGEQSIATSQGFNRPGPAPRDVIEEVGSGPNYSRQVAAPTPANVVMTGGRSVVANPRVVGWDQEGEPILKQPKAAFTNKDLQFPFPNRTNPGMAFIAASTEAPTTGIPGIDEVSVPVLTQLTGMHIPGIGQAVTTAGPYIAGLGRQAAGDIVDTARFAGSGLTYVAENLRPILAQGRADIGKGIRDLRQGYEDIGILGNQIGAAHNKYLVQPTQRLAGRIGLSLPTSAFQQSAPLETGKESILFDHPDVAQSGTGSDEVQNNRNYIAQGNVDLEGKPITVGEFDSAYPAEMYTDYRKFGVGGGGIKYLDAGNRYGGDPEMVGKVPSRRVKDEFISSAGIPQIDEELVGGSVEQPSSGGNIVTKLFDKAKALYDENTEIANEIAREDALIDEVRSAPPAGYEAYQRFDPRPAKKIPYISKVTGKPTGALMDAGGGSGVEYIGITGDGDTELDIDWQSKNPEKTTPGGYRFNSYLDSTGTTYRDSLVDSIADPRITGGAIGDQGIGTTVSDEIMDEKHARDDLQDTNYETVKEWLDTGRFGYGEDQVSPGKFAQKAKKSQATLSDFIAENKDRLGGN